MLNKQVTKQEFQKRSLLVSKIVEYIELNPHRSVASMFSVIFSPHVKEGVKHPYKWTDNELLGVMEKEIKLSETGNDEEDEY